MNGNSTNNPTKIYFLRRSKISLPDENLDILPTSIIHELQLIPNNQEVSIDSAFTSHLIRERKKSVPFEKIKTIYTAESVRCQQTARAVQDFAYETYSNKIEITPIHLLGEVEFRVDKVFPEFIKQYKTMNKSVIDQGIFRAMTAGLDWSESVQQCFWRVRYLFDIISKKSDQSPIIGITHDYIMRAIEVFIRTHGDKEITIEELMSTQRNYPLHGFITDSNYSFFQPLPEPSFINSHEKPHLTLHTATGQSISAETNNADMYQSCEIYFIRHSKLNLPYNGHNYLPSGIIRSLSQSSLDPTIDKWLTEELIQKRSGSLPFRDVGVIFTAASSRSQSTATAIQEYIYKTFNKKVDAFSFPYLSEVKFNFERVYPGQVNEFEAIDLNLLNQSVLKAMVAGQDCESLRQIYWKIDYFFEIIQKYKEKSKILIISHDYLMRAIELYIKRKHFTTVTYEDIIQTQRNSYLGGFATDYALSKFVSLPPVSEG